MTDNDVGQTYVTLRAERDAAKNRLDCARKKAEKLQEALEAFVRALRGQAEWTVLGGDDVRVEAHPGTSTPQVLEYQYPDRGEVLGILQSIKDAKQAIQQYDNFVE